MYKHLTLQCFKFYLHTNSWVKIYRTHKNSCFQWVLLPVTHTCNLYAPFWWQWYYQATCSTCFLYPLAPRPSLEGILDMTLLDMMPVTHTCNLYRFGHITLLVITLIRHFNVKILYYTSHIAWPHQLIWRRMSWALIICQGPGPLTRRCCLLRALIA